MDVVGSRLYFAGKAMGRPDFEGHLVEVKSESGFEPIKALDQIKEYASLVEGIPYDRRWVTENLFTFGRLFLYVAVPNLTEQPSSSLEFRDGRIGLLSVDMAEGEVRELVEAKPIWDEESTGHPYGPAGSVYKSHGLLVNSIDRNPILGKLYNGEDVWKEIKSRMKEYPRR